MIVRGIGLERANNGGTEARFEAPNPKFQSKLQPQIIHRSCTQAAGQAADGRGWTVNPKAEIRIPKSESRIQCREKWTILWVDPVEDAAVVAMTSAAKYVKRARIVRRLVTCVCAARYDRL
jgi:hypothetical protein